MSGFAALFIIAGITMAIPVLIAIGDAIMEATYRVRRSLPPRTPHTTLYTRHTARGQS
jgi:hypothetical protein